MKIRVGTRGSALARYQTGTVVEKLRRRGAEVEEMVIETEGDRDQTSAFPEIGAAGVFVREIERALLDGRIDLAVHSYKDLPSRGPDELAVIAVPERSDPADLLLIRAAALDEAAGRLPLRSGARVGTSSARRDALLRRERPDLEVAPLRGNVDTRVGHLVDGRYDAIVLAGAGVRRLRVAGRLADLAERGVQERRLSPDWFVPAPAQGALAVQARRADDDLAAFVEPLHDREAAVPLLGERRLLTRVEGDCELPFGVWCRELPGDGFALAFALGNREQLLVDEVRGDEPRLLADRAWDRLDAAGLVAR